MRRGVTNLSNPDLERYVELEKLYMSGEPFWHKKLKPELEQLKSKLNEKLEKGEAYLNEKCGYCNEKMIIIASEHIHACKHDLISLDKNQLIKKNLEQEQLIKQLQEELEMKSRPLYEIPDADKNMER